MTAEVVFIAPSLSRGRRQKQKEEYAYAFLRLEEACTALASYRSRGVKCQPALSRLALKLFCKESAALVDLVFGITGEKWMRRALNKLSFWACEIERCLDEFEEMPVERSPAADFLAVEIGHNLSKMRKRIRPILPDCSPYYRESEEDFVAQNGGSA